MVASLLLSFPPLAADQSVSNFILFLWLLIHFASKVSKRSLALYFEQANWTRSLLHQSNERRYNCADSWTTNWTTWLTFDQVTPNEKKQPTATATASPLTEPPEPIDAPSGTISLIYSQLQPTIVHELRYPLVARPTSGRLIDFVRAKANRRRVSGAEIKRRSCCCCLKLMEKYLLYLSGIFSLAPDNKLLPIDSKEVNTTHLNFKEPTYHRESS